MTDQIKNIITQLLTGIGMYFVGRGWITTDLLTSTIIPGLVTLVGFGYSIYLATRGAKVASVATPGTTVILPASESTMANSLGANVVTTADAKVVPK